MKAITWRYRRGLIMFHLNMPSGGTPVAAIIRATKALLAHVSCIGSPTEVDVSTHSEGEDAIKWNEGLDLAHVTAARLAGYRDITCVKVRMALHPQGDDGREFVIENGMLFWAQLADLSSLPGEPIEITLSLNADVYLSTSWGDRRDNRALAARNAPRFNDFLRAYQLNIGATLDGFSADDYPGQIDLTGIRV